LAINQHFEHIEWWIWQHHCWASHDHGVAAAHSKGVVAILRIDPCGRWCAAFFATIALVSGDVVPDVRGGASWDGRQCDKHVSNGQTVCHRAAPVSSAL
jgi:hypothetical protein